MYVSISASIALEGPDTSISSQCSWNIMYVSISASITLEGPDTLALNVSGINVCINISINSTGGTRYLDQLSMFLEYNVCINISINSTGGTRYLDLLSMFLEYNVCMYQYQHQ